MTKKRDQLARRRQVTKARKGLDRAAQRKGASPIKNEEQGSQTTDIWIAVGIVVLVVGALVALWYFAVRRPQMKEGISSVVVETPFTAPTPQTMSWPEPPAMTIDTAKDYEAVISTLKGDIRVKLYDDQAPVTVNNFVFLAREGFYDGVTFHRVIEGFMAQTGDPTGTGSGGPGYRFEDEFSPELRHDSEGIVSMANSGADTNGSQFFITYAPTPHLDDVHSVFGKVIEGMDVLRAVSPRDPDAGGPAGDAILSITIIEN